MPGKRLDVRIGDLFRAGKWADARRILEREREKEPEDHWVLTQLGVTYYEESRYKDALSLFLASLRIVPDCPLTLWNLAGTLDALGKYTEAMQIYTWLLESRKSTEEDPCWESQEWADALKTDCVYRLGVCFKHLGQKKKAEECLHQYLSIISTGIEGTYSIEDVRKEIRGLHGTRNHSIVQGEFRKAAALAPPHGGTEVKRGRSRKPPQFSEQDLFPGRRVASGK